MNGIDGNATTTALGGIKNATAALDRVASRVASSPDPERFPEDAVAMKEAVFAVKANTAVIKTQNEMLGSILDVLA